MGAVEVKLPFSECLRNMLYISVGLVPMSEKRVIFNPCK